MGIRDHLDDPLAVRRLFFVRLLWAAAVVLLVFGGLTWRLVVLQVVQHDHFDTLSEDNRIRLRPIPPRRGLIYDRNGVLLAENLPSYRLDLIPEEIDDLPATLAALGELIALDEQDIARFEKARRQHRQFDPVPLRYQLTPEELARFAVEQAHLPGVEIAATLTRWYPYGPAAAHVIGYVSAIDTDDLQRLDKRDYAGTRQIGKAGVERWYEDLLHGAPGHEQQEVNVQGRALRTLAETPQTPGQDLYLGLDIDLQLAAAQALGERRGAVVAIEPGTGEVLALVSNPAYDNNLFIDGIDSKTYRALNADPGRPLFNRALFGQYPPGSTIKPFLGLADVDIGRPLGNSGVYCNGGFKLPGTKRIYRDWKRTGHGRTDLTKAIEQSCDVYFYQLSLSLGVDRIHDYLTRFGFGQKTGIDLPGERAGLVPSKAWKRATRNESWYIGETLITSIGQGFNLATPLQLADATATLAARGVAATPRVARGAIAPLDGHYTALAPALEPPVTLHETSGWDIVHQAMHDVLFSPRGTARASAAGAAYEYAGKTGTAQVFGLGQDEEYDAETIAEHLRDHALFIAFAPLESPTIALAVVVEHGGSGSGTAAPIARQVLDAYLDRPTMAPEQPMQVTAQ